MKPAVIDASALIDSLLQSYPELDAAMDDFDIHAPELLGVEVLSTLRRLSLAHVIEPSHGAELLHLYSIAEITSHPSDVHLRRMWELRTNFSAYDATYVSLAELIECPLITRDFRLARAAEPYCEVIVPA